jgi:hypothetical protein
MLKGYLAIRRPMGVPIAQPADGSNCNDWTTSASGYATYTCGVDKPPTNGAVDIPAAVLRPAAKMRGPRAPLLH